MYKLSTNLHINDTKIINAFIKRRRFTRGLLTDANTMIRQTCQSDGRHSAARRPSVRQSFIYCLLKRL